MSKWLLAVCVGMIMASCNKEVDHFVPLNTDSYYPLIPGNYIDYDLDSTVFINFGSSKVVRHYQAREIVRSQMVDNMGRDSYTVERYLRQQEDAPWIPSITYLVTPTRGSLEVMENNLRYVKLAFPVRSGFSWKGNGFIDTRSTDLDLGYMDDWDYRYDSVGARLSWEGLNFDNTIKVFERDEFFGQDPESNPAASYAEKNFFCEKYAEDIGLIYREFLHWIYQGSDPGKSAYYSGYGIKMVITGWGSLEP